MISSCGSLGLFKEEAEEVAWFVLPGQHHLQPVQPKIFKTVHTARVKMVAIGGVRVAVDRKCLNQRFCE